MRRDLTINALFYNLDTRSVEDFTGRGVNDLRAGVIRTPLAPRETFMDGMSKSGTDPQDLCGDVEDNTAWSLSDVVGCELQWLGMQIRCGCCGRSALQRALASSWMAHWWMQQHCLR